jgi:hypothetical protein
MWTQIKSVQPLDAGKKEYREIEPITRAPTPDTKAEKWDEGETPSKERCERRHAPRTISR